MYSQTINDNFETRKNGTSSDSFEPVPSNVPFNIEMVICFKGEIQYLTAEEALKFMQWAGDHCFCQNWTGRCPFLLTSDNTVLRKWFDSKHMDHVFQTKYPCSDCSNVKFRHYHHKRCSQQQHTSSSGLDYESNLKKVEVDDKPKDCDLNVRRENNKTLYMAKQKSLDFKHKNYAQHYGQKRKSPPSRQFKTGNYVHQWLESHFDILPLNPLFLCITCPFNYRHYHSSFLTPKKEHRLPEAYNKSFKFGLTQIHKYKRNNGKQQIKTKVPDYVPNYTDMMITKPNSLEFFDKKDEMKFKKALSQYCPCQNGSKKCPLLVGRSLDCWFDDHIRNLEGWLYQVTYPCNGCSVPYRHFHHSWADRYISNSSFK